jgi:predicted dehydrogenase
MITLQNNTPLNFALIGCGRISRDYLQAVASIPECRLVCVSDICEQAIQSVAERYECKTYPDYHKILEDNHIDAVVICTPPNTHAEITTFFIENDIHVLCEKPFALNSRDAEAMMKLSEGNGRLLMMASKFRYVDDIIKAKDIVDSRILGDIILFENMFCSKVDMRDRWNSNKEISGGGVLIDNGSHSVDIARFLLGPIVEVQAEEGKRAQKLQVEDTSRLYFRTQSGVAGIMDLSWSIHKEKEYYIALYGTEGVLSIGWKGSEYKQSEKPEWIRFGSGYDKIAAFKSQIENFIGSIRGREVPLINAKDGLESVKVIEAAYESMSMNKWVEVKP